MEKMKTLGFVWALLLGLGCVGTQDSTAVGESAERTARQDSVAEMGSQVMPFDLAVTTHVFNKTETGGLQQVVSDADDPEQVRLIREHLAEEAERFQQGDFQDPGAIHGDEMPGLNELINGYQGIDIEYREIGTGAEILYESEDPQLVEALHAWFDVQLRDHGPHAQSHR